MLERESFIVGEGRDQALEELNRSRRDSFIMSSTPVIVGPFALGESYDQVLEALSDNKVKILTLGLYGPDNLNEQNVEVLAERLKENTSLRLLTFDLCTVIDDWVYKLFRELDQNPTLTKIHFKGNSTCINITDISAEHIAAYLKTTNSLASLVIEASHIGDLGASALAEALKVNKTICKFQIGGDNITNEGARALYRALPSNVNIISFAAPPFPNEMWYKKGQIILRGRKLTVDYSVLNLVECCNRGIQMECTPIFKKHCIAIKYALNEEGREDLVATVNEMVSAQNR